MQRFNCFCLVVKRSQFIFELIKACVEKLLKFHSDFKVKHDALVRAGVAAATKFSRINLIQLWQFDVRRVLIFILIFHPFEQSLISWPQDYINTVTHLSSVGPQTALCGEALATDVAVEGSVFQSFNLWLVVTEVLLQVRQLDERSATLGNVTFVGPLSCNIKYQSSIALLANHIWYWGRWSMVMCWVLDPLHKAQILCSLCPELLLELDNS